MGRKRKDKSPKKSWDPNAFGNPDAAGTFDALFTDESLQDRPVHPNAVLRNIAEAQGVDVDVLIQAAQGLDALDMTTVPKIQGPEAHGLSDTEYFQKLAGVSSEPSDEELVFNRFQEMPDGELLAYRSDMLLGVRSTRHVTVVNDELDRRGISFEERPAPFRGFHKGDCCDGTMLEFSVGGDEIDVCVAPPKFTEIDELHGDVICLGKNPEKFPSKIMVIGEGKHAHASYYNRHLIPWWMVQILDAALTADEATKELCKTLFEQMRQAVTKRPRKKKDGTSRRAVKELIPASQRDK